MRRGALAVAAGLVFVAGCAHAPNPKAAAPAVLRVSCTVPAQLYIDDRFVGTVGRALAIHPGFHRIELRAEGRFSSYRDVNLVAGEQKHLDVLLRPDLDAAAVESIR